MPFTNELIPSDKQRPFDCSGFRTITGHPVIALRPTMLTRWMIDRARNATLLAIDSMDGVSDGTSTLIRYALRWNSNAILFTAEQHNNFEEHTGKLLGITWRNAYIQVPMELAEKKKDAAAFMLEAMRAAGDLHASGNTDVDVHIPQYEVFVMELTLVTKRESTVPRRGEGEMNL